MMVTEFGIPIRNLWHMLLYAWNEPSLSDLMSWGEVENAPSLDALLAMVLIRRIQRRMRIGLGHGYVETSGRMRAIRGRIKISKSFQEQTTKTGEVECTFEQYSVNEPRNQILRSTLAKLVQAGELGPDAGQAEQLRHQLRWLVRSLSGIEMIDLTPESIRRLILSQNDNDYRLLLSICELVALRQMPLEADSTPPVPDVDRDALILHRIYERFVANFYRMHLQDWDVSPQKRLDWHAQTPNEHLPSMIPDLVLQQKASGQIMILDTKFTAGSLLENRWGKPLYDSSHLYQLYAYLKSQEHLSDEYGEAVGILLYPAVQARLSETVVLQDHTIRIENVDLAAKWEEVEQQLLELVSNQPSRPRNHP